MRHTCRIKISYLIKQKHNCKNNILGTKKYSLIRCISSCTISISMFKKRCRGLINIILCCNLHSEIIFSLKKGLSYIFAEVSVTTVPTYICTLSLYMRDIKEQYRIKLSFYTTKRLKWPHCQIKTRVLLT